MEAKQLPKIKIIFVEDYQIDQRTVIDMLVSAGYAKSNIQVCENRRDAEAAINRAQPELALVDIQIPKEPVTKESLDVGLGLIRWITGRHGQKTTVIALSRFPQAWVLYQVLACGVSFVDKRVFEELLWIIPRALDGHVVYTNRSVPIVRQAFVEGTRIRMDRQDMTILALIYYQDLTDTQIGKHLDYGSDWVGNRLKDMYKKTGIRERHQLASWFCEFIAPIQGVEPISLLDRDKEKG